MHEFARDDHGDQDLVLKSHELLDYVDFGVDDDVLEEDNIIAGVSLDVILEFGDLDDVDGAFSLLEFGDDVFFADVPLAIEGVFNRLVFDVEGFQNGDVLLLSNRINMVAVRLHQPNHGADFRTDDQ